MYDFVEMSRVLAFMYCYFSESSIINAIYVNMNIESWYIMPLNKRTTLHYV